MSNFEEILEERVLNVDTRVELLASLEGLTEDPILSTNAILEILRRAGVERSKESLRQRLHRLRLDKLGIGTEGALYSKGAVHVGYSWLDILSLASILENILEIGIDYSRLIGLTIDKIKERDESRRGGKGVLVKIKRPRKPQRLRGKRVIEYQVGRNNNQLNILSERYLLSRCCIYHPRFGWGKFQSVNRVNEHGNSVPIPTISILFRDLDRSGKNPTDEDYSERNPDNLIMLRLNP